MDERGYCTVEGRLKDMIAVAARTFIRGTRDCCSAIRRSASRGGGLPDEKWGEEVGRSFAPPGAAVPDELFLYMREHPLREHRGTGLVEAFPLTGSARSGFKLRESFVAGEVKALYFAWA